MAGFSESIWHFLGYLHIADTVARADKVLDGEANHTITIDVVAAGPPQSRFPTDVDDLGSRSIGIQIEAIADTIIAPRETPREMDEIEDIEGLVARIRSAASSLPPAFRSGFGDGGVLTTQRVIGVSYDDDAQQTLDAITQVNRMIDADVVTSGDIRILTPAGWGDSFAMPDTQDTIRQLLAEAQAMTPREFAGVGGGDTSDVIAFIKARDAGRAAGETQAEPQVAPGRYVDGVLSDDEPTPLPEAPVIEGRQNAEWETVDGVTSRTITGPSDGIGAVTYSGGNELINAAGIRDLSGLSASIIIEGDAFLSNAIFQVNILVDNDTVDLALALGPDPLLTQLLRSAEGDGNIAQNIAEFVEHSYTSVLRGAAFTPMWEVDVVEGDFFSIRTLSQINFLTDTDCISQSASETFFQIRTGDNQQVNLANVYGFDFYDVIIIGGNSHRANWIFQKNIVLDDDRVTSMLGSAEGGSQMVWAGGNSLVNEARISVYGNDGYSDLGDAQRDLIAALQRQDGTLLPDPAWQMAGSATGTLKVLYITGDCYDINLISQTNILCDVDQLAQYATGAGAVAGAVTGFNAVSNYAEIVDAGTLSGSAFLGGEAYEDSILVQASIVTDQNQITIQDAGAYVPELIAFTGEQAECGPDGIVIAAGTCDPNPYDNPGQVMT
jgi:hypothetical protein